MERLERNPLGLSKAGMVMALWGVPLFLAGIVNQWYYPGQTQILAIWGAVTLLGVVTQAVCEVRDQRTNFFAWLVAIVAGWLFTFYVVYANNSLYVDLAPAWLALLGLAYIPTALQIDRRYWALAGLHLIVAFLMELAGRNVLAIDFLFRYGAFIFGLVSGGSLVIGALFGRVKIEAPSPGPSLSAPPPVVG